MYLISTGKQVIHDVMKQEVILEVNKFNANVLTYLDGDGAYDESGQQKNSSTNSKSHTSVNTSYDQVRNALHATMHNNPPNVYLVPDLTRTHGQCNGPEVQR